MTNTTHATIVRLALPTPLRRLFDYLPPQDVDINKLIPGVRIRVPFQSRVLVGILIAVDTKTSVPYGKLKYALQVLDLEPILSPDVAKICAWAAEYYHYALGEVLMSALPTLLRNGKSLENIEQLAVAPLEHKQEPLSLNTAQQHAITAIAAVKDSFQVFLLDGVTGSGKTEVYLQASEEVIKAGKQVLMLVPEISLTPQTTARFSERYGRNVVVMHSGLSAKQRLSAWQAARNGQASIVIGTRSAIFTPFLNLGMIIVDEEHDASFKQQDRLRYHARDLAVVRANTNGIPVVLGSATPSLESLLNVKRNRYDYLSLTERAGGASMPTYQIIDLRNESTEDGLSVSLLQAMRHHLAQDNQVMLFLNRRGFAPVLYCTQCTWVAECRRCDARMVYHRKKAYLQCHHCDSQTTVPVHCGRCQAAALQPVGVGTERLERALERHFADVPIIRIDRDSTQKKGSMQVLLEKVHTHTKAILLGTQMLAKGHHFPRVTLVGMIDADSGLFSADFRAAEQMGQLLVQVSGRAGRAEKIGTVAIQTRHPDHVLLNTLIQQGYQPYAQTLLTEREQALLPPFSYFAMFRAEAYTEKNANRFLEEIKKIGMTLTESVTVLGPVPALLSKRKGLHCQQLLVRSNRRNALQSFLKNILQRIDKASGLHSVKWVLDVDPVEML